MSSVEGEIDVMVYGHVARVELRRPPYNYVNASMLANLADTFEKLDSNPEIRCIILASHGKTFCAGADFSNDKGSGATARQFYGAAVRLFATRKPIVAAIQGAAVGAGLGLASVADFRIASPEARFSANFVKLGIHPGFGLTYTLPRIVGQQNAALLLYTGRRLGGEEAKMLGLVDRLVNASELQNTAFLLASEIAENAPLAVEATRATLRRGLADAIATQTSHEAKEQERLFSTADYQEGLRAVTERRPGRFCAR